MNSLTYSRRRPFRPYRLKTAGEREIAVTHPRGDRLRRRTHRCCGSARRSLEAGHGLIESVEGTNEPAPTVESTDEGTLIDTSGPVLPVALPRAAIAGGRRIRSRSPRPPTGGAAHHRQGPRRLLVAHRARSSPARACSPKARSASFTDARAPQRQGVLIAGGIGITPIRALLEEMRRRRDRALPRHARRGRDLPRRARGARAANATVVHYVVGDHRRRGPRSALAGPSARARARTSPSAMSSCAARRRWRHCIRKSVREARVPAPPVHAERFALL